MIIEIRGVGVENKGAFLMLKAILAEFKKRGVEVVILAEETKSFPAEYRINEGILKRTNTFKKGFDFSFLLKWIPFSIRKRAELFLQEDVDCLIDASGFLLGDQWGAKTIEYRIGKDIEKLKRNGTKIILLPQAAGPFKNRDVRKISKYVFDNSDLVFIRDRISYAYVQDLNIRTKPILAPDFTNILEVSHIDLPKNINYKEYIAIIPNQKLVEQKTAGSQSSYILFLMNLIKAINKTKYKPLFLIHSGKKDYGIALKINSELTTPLLILNEDNPLVIKGMIGQFHGLITGRFHGLVSALSQGVPALATSWSHKYEMLLEDYDFKEGILPITDDSSVIEEKLNCFFDGQSYLNVKHKILERAAIQKSLTKNMWDVVFKKLGEKSIDNTDL